MPQQGRVRPTTSDVHIHEALAEDLPTVVRLRLRFIADDRGVEAAAFGAAFRIATEQFLRRRHEAGTARSWLATDDDSAVGIITMLVLDLAPRPGDVNGLDGYLVNLWVDPAARRRGIGRALLGQCLDASAVMPLRRLVLSATEDGRPLYTSAGFESSPDWMERPTR